MDPKILQTIIQFMQRVQLQGGEVPAFVACMNELNRFAQEQQHQAVNGRLAPDTPPPVVTNGQ